jgi:poly(hydroxyalkanoate) depolymerase family esterase
LYRMHLLKYVCIVLFFMCETFAFAQFSQWNMNYNNPGNLNAFIYKPSNYSDTVSYPMVVVLHGCSQNAKEVAVQSGWMELADSNQFILVFPEQKLSNNMSRCFNWFFEEDIVKGRGEAESIYQIRKSVSDSLKIDEEQVFIYGLSAGAAMSVAVLSCYPNEFKAGAILAGGPYKTISKPFQAPVKMRFPDILPADSLGKKVKEQNPDYDGKYPSLIVLHGLRDIVVSYENTNEIVKQWTNIHNTDEIPEAVFLNYDAKENFERYEYKNASDETVVIKYFLKQIGHKLPVDPGKGYKQGGKRGLFAEDVDIFSTWYIANDFGLIKK